jgi:hypothetical protein
MAPTARLEESVEAGGRRAVGAVRPRPGPRNYAIGQKLVHQPERSREAKAGLPSCGGMEAPGTAVQARPSA